MGPIKVKPENFTNYEKIVIDAGSLTVQGLIDKVKEVHGVECYQFLFGDDNSDKSIYYMYEPKHANRLDKKVEDIVTEEFGAVPASKRYLRLSCSSTLVEDGSECVIPPVKYFFR